MSRVPRPAELVTMSVRGVVLGIRIELTDRVLVFGERHLWHLPNAYVRHCNGQRPYPSRQLRRSRVIWSSSARDRSAHALTSA
jgi:hypothetical protein